MTNKKLSRLIHKLEEFSRRRPREYAFRVFLLASIGYGYIFLVMAILSALAILLVWSPFYMKSIITPGEYVLAIFIYLIPLVMILTMLFRSLFVTMQEPQGIKIQISELPHLADLVHQLRQMLSCPDIHRIIITDDFNASVMQFPRLGVIGFFRNYLVIGLPLMDSLTPDQFKALLAHELAHLSGSHHRFAGKIYRLNATWANLTKQLQTNRQAAFLFRWFINWFFPYFHAYTFVARRSHEFEADLWSVKATSTKVAAQLLVGVSVRQQLLTSQVWPLINSRIPLNTPAPGDAVSLIAKSLAGNFSQEAVTTILAEMVRQKTDLADTHPCLADRLQAIGVNADDPQATFPFADDLCTAIDHRNTAETLLGDRYQHYLSELDKAWYQTHARTWQKRCDEYRQGREIFLKLSEAKNSRSLSEQEMWELASLTITIEGANKAEPFLRDLLDQNPGHIYANVTMGRLLLQKRDERGLEHFERVIRKRPNYLHRLTPYIHSFFVSQGKLKEFYQYMDKLNEIFRQNIGPLRKWAMITPKTPLKSHSASPWEIEHLVKQIREEKTVKSAYLVEKDFLENGQGIQEPFFMLVIIRQGSPVHFLNARARNFELANILVNKIQFPYDFNISIFHNHIFHIVRKVRKIKGSLIYTRTSDSLLNLTY